MNTFLQSEQKVIHSSLVIFSYFPTFFFCPFNVLNVVGETSRTLSSLRPTTSAAGRNAVIRVWLAWKTRHCVKTSERQRSYCLVSECGQARVSFERQSFCCVELVLVKSVRLLYCDWECPFCSRGVVKL